MANFENIVNPKRRARYFYWGAVLTVWVVGALFPYSLISDEYHYTLKDSILTTIFMGWPALIMNYWIFSYRNFGRSILTISHSILIPTALIFSFLAYPLVMIIIQCLITVIFFFKAEKWFGKKLNTEFKKLDDSYSIIESELTKNQFNLLELYSLHVIDVDTEKFFKLAFFDGLIRDVIALQKTNKKDEISGISVSYKNITKGRNFNLRETNELYSILTDQLLKKQSIQERFYISRLYNSYGSYDSFHSEIKKLLKFPFNDSQSKKAFDYLHKLIDNIEFAYHRIDEIDPKIAYKFLQVIGAFCFISEEIDDKDLSDQILATKKRFKQEGHSGKHNTELGLLIQEEIIERVLKIAPKYFLKQEDIVEIFSIDSRHFMSHYSTGNWNA